MVIIFNFSKFRGKPSSLLSGAHILLFRGWVDKFLEDAVGCCPFSYKYIFFDTEFWQVLQSDKLLEILLSGYTFMHIQ